MNQSKSIFLKHTEKTIWQRILFSIWLKHNERKVKSYKPLQNKYGSLQSMVYQQMLCQVYVTNFSKINWHIFALLQCTLKKSFQSELNLRPSQHTLKKKISKCVNIGHINPLWKFWKLMILWIVYLFVKVVKLYYIAGIKLVCINLANQNNFCLDSVSIFLPYLILILRQLISTSSAYFLKLICQDKSVVL